MCRNTVIKYNSNWIQTFVWSNVEGNHEWYIESGTLNVEVQGVLYVQIEYIVPFYIHMCLHKLTLISRSTFLQAIIWLLKIITALKWYGEVCIFQRGIFHQKNLRQATGGIECVPPISQDPLFLKMLMLGCAKTRHIIFNYYLYIFN